MGKIPGIETGRQGCYRREAAKNQRNVEQKPQKRIAYRKLKKASGVFFFLLVVGCSYFKRVPLPPLSESLSLPGETVSSPQPILNSLQERRNIFQDLGALAKISIRSSKGNYNTDQVILLRSPSSLRLETLGMMGNPSLYILVDKVDLTLYSPYERKLLRGKALAANIFKLTGLPLTASEIVDLLSGSVPTISEPSRMRVAYHAGEGLYWLQVLGDNGRPYQRTWVGAEDLVPKGYQLYDAQGKVYLIAQYEDYTLLDGYFFPYKIKVHLPQEKAYIELTYQEVSLNQGVSASLFQLPVPPNVDIIELP